MSSNFLKLNADKTEVLVIGFRAQLAKFNLSSLKIAGVDVSKLILLGTLGSCLTLG